LCIVAETKGSTPRKAGARMLVFADGSSHGRIEGTLGGGAIEHRVREQALLAIAECKPRQIQVALTHELAMCCGGSMSVYIEPLVKRPPCIILGGGHIAAALWRMANVAGFDVSVADPRADIFLQECWSGLNPSRRFDGYSTFELDRMPFAANSFVVIATHSHQTDQELVEAVLARSFCYLGLVGSRRKAFFTTERLLAKGFDRGLAARVSCPAGLDIGAETPEEIALAIVAQMIQVRRVGTKE
jgi:xanthine dehydrogenase accessory factor